MIRRAASLLTVVLFAVPISSGALGLGDIQLNSALNQPVDARIPLRSMQPGDSEGMKVTLGTTEQFRRAGVERPFILSQLRFRIVERPDGDAFIRISTAEPVSEPFLNFLLEVDWPRGRIVREYTLLLDPPVYGAAISATVKESVVVSEAPPPLPPAQLRPSGAPERAETGRGPTRAASAGWNPPGTTYGPTTNTDTLWSLADRFRGDGSVSIQQMMLAMLRINPDAFNENNVNTLKAGAVLLIPTRADVEAVTRAEALAEVRRHHAAWEEIRQSLAAGTLPGPRGRSAAPASPTPGAAGTPAAGTGGESSGEPALKLVGSGTAEGTPGATSSAAGAATSEELNLALEEADRQRRENAELKGQLSQAEDLVADLQRLVQVQSDDIAALQQRLAEQESAQQAEPAPTSPPVPVATPAPAPAPAAPATPEPPVAQPPPADKPPAQAAAPAPAKPRVPLPPAQPTSFLDIALGQLNRLPGGAMGFGGGVLGIIVLALLGLFVAKRRKSGAEEPEAAPAAVLASEDVTELPADESETAAPAADISEDVTEVPEIAAGAAEEAEAPTADPMTATVAARAAADEEDPLAEVNVYLAYERFDQAEALVVSAVEKHPDRQDYKLKLLEVFHTAKNVAGFEAAAMTLQAAVGDDSPLMEKARGWWRELSPERALFAEAATPDFNETHVGLDTEAPIFDVTGGDESAAPSEEAVGEGTGGVDFDLGLDFESGEDDTEAVGEGTTVDFNLGADDADADAEAAADTGAGSGTELDFDLGEEPETAVGEGTGLDFDLGDTEDEPAAEAPVGSDSDLDFDLGEAAPERPAEPDEAPDEAPAAAVGSDSDLDFDLGEAAPETGDEPAEPDEAPAAAIGSDSELDFDLGEAAPEAGDEPAEPDEAPAAAVGSDSELDFDLDFAADAGDGEAAAPDEAAEADAGGAAEKELDFALDDEPATAGADDDTIEGLDLDFSADDPAAPAPDADALGPDEETVDVSNLLSPDSGDTDADLDLDLDLDLPLEAEPAGDAAADDDSIELPEIEADADDDGATGGASGLEGTVTSLQTPPLPEVSGEEPPLDVGAVSDDDTIELGEITLDADDEVDPDALKVDTEFAGLFESDEGEESAPEPEPLGEGTDEVTNLNLDIPVQDAAPAAEPAPETPEVDEDFADVFGDAEATGAGGDTQMLDEITDVNPDEPGGAAAGDDDLDLVLDAPEEGDTPDEDTAEIDLDLGDFDLELPGSDADEADIDDEKTVYSLRDTSTPETDAGDAGDEDGKTLVLGRGPTGDVDEVQTKLDLAQAYMDMGDTDGARNILGEVMAEGNDAQRGEAETLLKQLG